MRRGAVNSHESTLAEHLAKHLAAIGARDLDAYTATLHDQVTLILPNGTVHAGRQAVVDFHRGFFADPDWRQDFTAERLVVTGRAASALYRVEYHDVDTEGAPYHRRFLVGLLFVPVGDRWLLLHDQCTSLPAD